MKPSVIERLNSLRNFVGNAYSESDLSSCLRQAGYDVNVAANLLLTGDFTPSPTAASSRETSSLRQKRPSPSSSINNTSPKPSSSSSSGSSNNSSNHQTPSNHNSKRAKCDSTSTSASTSISTTTNPGCYTTPTSRQSAAVTPTTPSAPKDDRWLLCQRWVSDGVCTQRNGRLAYQESLTIESGEGSRLVRFRGSNIQGQFPKRLSAFLAPLLQLGQQHIQLTASALMEERYLPIGAQIPFSLSVWLNADPTSFFDLFEKKVDASYSRNGLLGGSNNKSKGMPSTPETKAAFALLQWAQLGDALEDFDAASSSDDEQQSDNDDDDDEVLLLEEDEQQAVNAESEETKVALDASENNHCPEMDEPDQFGCQLRPYQKESLWWMVQREKEEENAAFLRQQLQVLNDLAESSSTMPKEKDGVEMIVNPGISCDCGPVTVSAMLEAPPIENDRSTPADLDHPLWERRYLCSSDRARALSFYVQPFFGVASASPPVPPKPCRGGLLCDSMGLGKTIQMLALIQTSKQEQMETSAGRGGLGPKTTLIVTPLSLLVQWEEEIKTKTNMTSCVHYGDNKRGSFSRVDVVLTTYGTLQGEMRASLSRSNKQKNNNNKMTSQFIPGGGLLSHAWKRVILDEAHCIKNTSTVASRACCLLQAERRWCVSGTIIQNSLEDAYAQLKFLRHEPWHNHGFWNTAITREPDSNVALGRVQKVLAPIMIRRTKDSVDKEGKPILSLPPVETKTIMVEFSEAERQFYDALFTKSLSLFEGFIQTGSVSKSWLAIFSLINRLRQTCDHVALILKKHMAKDEWESRISSTQRIEEGEEEQQQPEPEPAEMDNGIDSQFLNSIMGKFKAMQNDGAHSTQQQSSFAQKVAERLNGAAQGKGELEECPLTLDPIDVESAAVTPCFHVFSRDGLMDVIKTQKKKTTSTDFPCPVCNEHVSASKVLSISKQDGDTQISYLYDDDDGDDDSKPVAAPNIEEDTSGARQVLETAISGSMSAKLAAISKELENVWEEDPGSKVLIFSQFLGFLDMMEHEFGGQGITTFRLDGSLALKDRVKVIQEFGQSKKTNSATNRTGSVLLISMKAGGVGLNLVAASSCFIADPWWNGAVEDQCVNRIHRIGQTADKVRVRKFYVANSVEQRILKLQEKKKRIANQIMAEGSSGTTDLSAGQPSLEDLKELFQTG